MVLLKVNLLKFGLALFLALTGFVVQFVTCLTSDLCLTADPGVVLWIPPGSYTFVEINHEYFLRPFSSILLSLDGFLSVTCESMWKSTD